MITYVTRQDFHDQFIHSKRDNFSYEMREALFDYLEQIEIASGRPITLDVISLCCDYVEVEGGGLDIEYEGFGDPVITLEGSRLFEQR